jgi:hypothetical protein
VWLYCGSCGRGAPAAVALWIIRGPYAPPLPKTFAGGFAGLSRAL